MILQQQWPECLVVLYNILQIVSYYYSNIIHELQSTALKLVIVMLFTLFELKTEISMPLNPYKLFVSFQQGNS